MPPLRGRAERLVYDFVQYLGEVRPGAVDFAGQQPIGDLAERKKVRGGADLRLIAARLLGCHVLGSPEDLPRLRRGRRVGRDSGNAEIEDFDERRTVLEASQKYVLWFEIAVDDPDAVGLVEGQGDLPEPLDDVLRAERFVVRKALEITTLEQVHDQVRRATELGRDVGVEDSYDVLAADLRGRPRLTLEARDGVGRRPEVGFHHFERQELARKRVFHRIHGSGRSDTQDVAGPILASDHLR